MKINVLLFYKIVHLGIFFGFAQVFLHYGFTLKQPHIMAKEIAPKDNSANQQNANKGSNGTNKQYDQAQGNRGKQQNPKQNPSSKD